MATAESTFTYEEQTRSVAGHGLSAVSGADDRNSRAGRAEFLYRIFCGEDERLQELAVAYLSESN